MIRSTLFNLFFYAATALYAVIGVVFSLVPGRALLMTSLRRYTQLVRWGLRTIAGVTVEVTGHERVPDDGPVIIAAKHQSYGDGIVMFHQFDDLSFVTGDHLEKFWLIKVILAKMNAVVVESCGGAGTWARMAETSRIVREQGRRILIYPEGHLSRVGTHHPYKKGVWHLQQDFDCPVVPVATNLGQRWNQRDWIKHPGPAKVEFLDPIPPGLGKEAFMTRLQDRIETRSLELLDHAVPGALDPDDIGKLALNKTAQARAARNKAPA
ncbi:1-acyl-sn-glycerol-3-phosphate acyltransferase [uncultured Algimonas sp.]|uniref:lysophospholipid acyltransferase family protein n=1 Tax=uncultured Algimonas sp. TaxID=1547920 RepID=UPI00263A034B|nr:1-acyl-sn-glycerol-3-phosphate acyltransferase [uncultured Algimonas sp.]